MNFEIGPFSAARAAFISSGLFDRPLVFIAWETCGNDAALWCPPALARQGRSFGRPGAPSLPRKLARSSGIQPLHVIGHTLFEGKLRLIAKGAPDTGQVGLGKILVVRVRI